MPSRGIFVSQHWLYEYMKNADIEGDAGILKPDRDGALSAN